MHHLEVIRRLQKRTWWCYGDGMWDKEGAWGTTSKCKTTGRYTKGAQCGTLAVMVVV